MIFDQEKAKRSVSVIRKEFPGCGRKYPVYKFYGEGDAYICKAHYSGPDVNTLQRGLWTDSSCCSLF